VQNIFENVFGVTCEHSIRAMFVCASHAVLSTNRLDGWRWHSMESGWPSASQSVSRWRCPCVLCFILSECRCAIDSDGKPVARLGSDRQCADWLRINLREDWNPHKLKITILRSLRKTYLDSIVIRILVLISVVFLLAVWFTLAKLPVWRTIVTIASARHLCCHILK